MRIPLSYLAISLGLWMALAFAPQGTARGQDVTPIDANPVDVAELRDSLIQAKKPKDRDLFFDELVNALPKSAAAQLALEEALIARWDRAVQKLLDFGLESKFTKLLKQREQLEVARKAALDLIEDEEAYFYPYRQPDVSADKAAQYHKVQTQVSKLVAELEGVWRKSAKVKLSTTARRTVEELDWLRTQNRYVSEPLLFPAGTPAWLAHLAPDVDRYDLSSLAMDRIEAEAMRRNRQIQRYNERVWKAAQEPKRKQSEVDQKAFARYPQEAEREQVRVTNEYRAMYGRRALTWDARLQEAAHRHSAYQSRTGEFGHYQKIEATRTPFQRMRLAGYTRGVSENCSKGNTDPSAALAGWMRSSGHHRNMIAKGHREMASAISGDIWTQNYGLEEANLESGAE